MHKRHAIAMHVYGTNDESMMSIDEQRKSKIKMDSYDVPVHPIQNPVIR